MVDKALILRKIAELEEYGSQLKEFSGISIQEYESDWKCQRIVERTLQIVIELCADVANHIISDRSYRVATSYADIFKVLHEQGLLQEPLFKTMEKIARFRNILVHHYEKIDSSVIVGILKSNLDDLMSYRDAILAVLTHD